VKNDFPASRKEKPQELTSLAIRRFHRVVGEKQWRKGHSQKENNNTHQKKKTEKVPRS